MTKSLPDMYWDLIVSSIDETGVFPHQGIIQASDGKLTMLSITDNLNVRFLTWLTDHAKNDPMCEIIYGFDRYTQPDQETEFQDCIAGAYYKPFVGWLPFVIDYQHEPRIVRPINWRNFFWRGAVARELSHVSISIAPIP